MRDPLSLGFIGRNGAYPGEPGRPPRRPGPRDRRALRRPLGLVLDAGLFLELPAYASSIHVDVDHAELGRNYAPDLGILADARAFLRQLLSELERRRIDGAPRLPAWHAAIAGWRAEWAAFVRPGFETHATPIRPERIVADCRAVLPDDAIISLDSGIHHNWFMQFWEARRPQTMLNTWGYSGMGFGPSVDPRRQARRARPALRVDLRRRRLHHGAARAVHRGRVRHPGGLGGLEQLRLGGDPRPAIRLFRRPRDRHRLLPGPEPRALQPRFRGLGEGRRRGRATPSPARRTSPACSSRRSPRTSPPDRRPRRRRHPPARHRRLGAAADPAQGADLRQRP